MKLSSFDISSYLNVPMERHYVEESSRPGLNNFLGSVQADSDPTGIRHPIFPPVSSAEESTCYLTVNGEFLPSTGVATIVRWSPHRIARECRWLDWEIRSVLAMVPGEHAIVQRIIITSKSRTPATLKLGVRLSGRCVNRGMKPWFWEVPQISTQVFELIAENGLAPLITRPSKGCVLTQERRMTKERMAVSLTGKVKPADFADMGKAFNAQCLSPAPDSWLSNGDAFFERVLPPKESLTIDFALALDTTDAAATLARRTVRSAEKIISAQEKGWKKMWKDVFREGKSPFGGTLPDLDVPKALAPIAASAILNLLQCRRTHRVTRGKTFYNILTPRRNEVCFYTWDWGLATGAMARLDPAAVKRQLEIVWKNDFRKFMQFNFVTGQPSGWRYGADIFSLFYATWNYWRACGGNAAALQENLATRKGSQTILKCLEELAFDWRKRRNPEFGLGDYGPKGDLLECVTTYAHMVASLNAASCWMLDALADLYEMLGRADAASKLREESQELTRNLVKHLYVEGGGYFACLQPDGRKIECRHAYDLGMVLWCVGDRLPKRMQGEMVDYFQRELQTPSWIRALSPHDRDAGTSGSRADHQFSGSYCCWAGLVALGLLKIGRRQIVAKWLKGIARTALQGPFGQAHWDERVVPPTAGGATKVTDEFPQGCHWCDVGGALYFHVVEQFLADRK